MKKENGVLSYVRKEDLEFLRENPEAFWEGVTSIGEFAFSLRKNLESINIPKGVTSIGKYAFYVCENLKSITIPEGVKSIGREAFYGCENLKSITIPEGVKSIGKSAFSYCENLESIVIPEGVTSIGDETFRGCKNLESIVIPEGVTSIGASAFSNCQNLKSIRIPESVTSIGREAFYGCENLKSITIPEGVKSIGESAFSYCENLESIVIPEGVTSIGASAFSNCQNLKSIRIPESVTSIGREAFYGCENLKSITIPEGVKSIGREVFYGCENLKSIILPESLENIEEGAFYDCAKCEIEFCGVKIKPEEENKSGILRFLVKNKERKADFKKLGIANICYNIIDAQLDLDMFSFKEATTQLTLRQWRTIVKRMNIGESQEAFSGVALDDLSRLAKVLGLFNNAATVEIKNPQGKLQKVKACDLAFNFFQKFVQDVPTGNMHRFLQGVQDNGFSGEFLKFVSNKTNYSEVIEKLNSNDDFLNMTYAWFRQRDELDLQQVSNSSLPQTEANRYKIKTIAVSEDGVEREHWNVPTAELLMKEFMTRKYSGINSTRDREIAEQFTAHTQYEQMHFEKAKEIDAERLQAGVPDFIVGTQVKNNRTQVYERFLNSAKKREYFEQTESLRDQIVDEAADALRAQKDISDKIFTYETLAKSDIANFYIGQLTNCCARLYAAGSGAMRAAILSPDMQPLVVRNDKDEIIAYSIMYINREQGYAVLNDIEVNSKYDYDPDLEKNTLIYEAMKECAVKNIQEFNKTASVKVKTLTAGLSPRVPKINDVIRKNPTTQTFKAPNFDDYKYVGAKSWRGDWHGTQYLIWSADEKAIEREGL